MGDLGLWLILAAFVAWEAFAHFVARNRGAHTLSNRVWELERRHPWTRVLVALAMVVATSHLVLHIP